METQEMIEKRCSEQIEVVAATVDVLVREDLTRWCSKSNRSSMVLVLHEIFPPPVLSVHPYLCAILSASVSVRSSVLDGVMFVYCVPVIMDARSVVGVNERKVEHLVKTYLQTAVRRKNANDVNATDESEVDRLVRFSRMPHMDCMVPS